MDLNASHLQKRKETQYLGFWVVSHSNLHNNIWYETGRTPVWGGLRDERVNQGEGACTGAYSIKPPQERTTRTACVKESRSLTWFDLFPPAGLVRDARTSSF